MRSFDFLDLLGDAPEDLVESCFAEPAAPAGIRRSVWAPRIVSGAAAAACLAAVCGMGFLLRDDGMTMQSSTMETLVAPETERPAETTAPAFSAPPEQPAAPAQTAQTVQTTAALPAETTAQPAETAPAATESPAETAPAETTPAPAETAPAETAPAAAAPQTPVFEPGDVDMDGKITFVDAALVKVEYSLACAGRLNESMITPEQRALGNVNGLDDGELLNAENPVIEYVDEETGELVQDNNYDPFPLGIEDFHTIQAVAELRNWYGLDITVEEYLNRQEEDVDFFSDYQDTHEKIRPDIEEAQDLLEKMGGALVTHFFDESPNGLITSELINFTPTYNAEDFRHMAEEMLTYFEDVQ